MKKFILFLFLTFFINVHAIDIENIPREELSFFEIYAVNEYEMPIANRCYNFLLDYDSQVMEYGCTNSDGYLSIYIAREIPFVVIESEESDKYEKYSYYQKLDNLEYYLVDNVVTKEDYIEDIPEEFIPKDVTIFVSDESGNPIANRCYNFYIHDLSEEIYDTFCSNAEGWVKVNFEFEVESLIIKSSGDLEGYGKNNFYVIVNLDESKTFYEVFKKLEDNSETILDVSEEQEKYNYVYNTSIYNNISNTSVYNNTYYHELNEKQIKDSVEKYIIINNKVEEKQNIVSKNNNNKIYFIAFLIIIILLTILLILR